MIEKRLAKLRKELKDREIQAMIVEKPENVFYLSGFTGSEGILIVGEDQVYLLVDSRYIEQAQLETASIQIELCEEKKGKALSDILGRLEAGAVGFESHFQTYRFNQEIAEQLSKNAVGLKLEPLNRLVEKLRAVKDEDEISTISHATRLLDAAFLHIISFVKEGVSEEELAVELEHFLRKEGASKIGFEVIIAAGANSSMPHAKTTGKRLKSGDLLLMDFGAVFEGYHSDMTRTIVVGNADDKVKDIYQAVKEAQELALDSIKAGESGKNIDSLVRQYFEGKGYQKEFGHNLGHGVGLEIHELPVLGRKSEDILEENMVTTVEPGLYFPDFGGVRIEDMVIINKDGVEVLTRSPNKLMEI